MSVRQAHSAIMLSMFTYWLHRQLQSKNVPTRRVTTLTSLHDFKNQLIKDTINRVTMAKTRNSTKENCWKKSDHTIEIFKKKTYEKERLLEGRGVLSTVTCNLSTSSFL